MTFPGLAAAQAPAIAVELGGIANVEEDALHLLEVGPPPAVEAHAALPAIEEFGPKMALEHADTVGDGGGGDAELLARMGEALVSGGGLEESQAVERRQGIREFGHRERPGSDKRKNFFVID